MHTPQQQLQELLDSLGFNPNQSTVSNTFCAISTVRALQDLYRSFNTPPQLKGWKSNGGDPCQESWTGISCAGSSIIQM